MRNNQWYGWRPDLPDHRDRRYALRRGGAALPPAVDLRALCPPIYDQGSLGSCTGNAIAAAIQFDLIRQQESSDTPSRLFIYYNERVMEGTVSEDAGAEIRDGIKSVATLGAPPETDWPYNVAQFAAKPPDPVYVTALSDKVLTYERIDNTQLDLMKDCLVAGLPFVFGFTVYESFESEAVAQSGVVELPASGEQVVGGHAVMCVGYDDATGRFIVRNSWGVDWGKEGYFTMPYAYLTNQNLADDFWAIQTMGSRE